MKKRNYYTFTDRLLNWFFQSKTLYIVFVLGLILLYPVAVIDGQRWTYVKEVGIKLPLKYKTHGIDLSHHNGDIDWEKVVEYAENSTAVKFCFLKATEGTDLVDKKFATHWQKLDETEIIRGAYHYFNPYSDPRLQALNYILNVKLQEGDFVPVLDFEDNVNGSAAKAKLKENVKIWLEIIEKHYKVKPIIYTNKFIYNQYIKGNFSQYPLWISQYGGDELEGFDEGKVYFWQHSMQGRIEGIPSNVDINAYLGAETDLNQLLVSTSL